MQPDFDVLVAGGGAGGAAAACFLAQQGLRVQVVEKARLPRYKPCGGAIPRPVLERFPFSLQDTVRATPAELRFTYPGLPPVDVPLADRPLVMVMRSEFDACLLAHSGAEVLDGTAVTGVEESPDGVRVWVREQDTPTLPSPAAAGEDERVLTARYLVGADGAASQVARRLGLRHNRRLGGTLEADVPLEGRPELQAQFGRRVHFSLGVLPRGYAWVFPKGDCLSVGIGRFLPGQVDLRSALREEMLRLGIPLDGIPLHGHPIPGYQAPPWPWGRRRPQARLSTRRCLLVGDAAGLVDPLIGEGIRYAIASARLAAAAIARDDLAGYEAAVWREIGHSLATCGVAADLIYRWPRRFFQLGVRNPATVRQFVDVLTERASYIGIGRRLVAATVSRLFQRRGAENRTSAASGR